MNLNERNNISLERKSFKESHKEKQQNTDCLEKENRLENINDNNQDCSPLMSPSIINNKENVELQSKCLDNERFSFSNEEVLFINNNYPKKKGIVDSKSINQFNSKSGGGN